MTENFPVIAPPPPPPPQKKEKKERVKIKLFWFRPLTILANTPTLCTAGKQWNGY